MTPAFHEWGEWLALALSLVGLTEERLERWFHCYCSQRREWLNELGESFWSRLPLNHHAAHRLLFAEIVFGIAREKVVAEDQLYAAVTRSIRLSLPGFRRWADRLEQGGSLAHVITFHKINGRMVERRLYGVRAG